jgi:hypothetical protein
MNNGFRRLIQLMEQESQPVVLVEQEWQPVIDDDIPLPPPERGSGAVRGSKFERRLPLRTMQIGQSLFVPSDISEYPKLANRISRLTANFGIRFAVRQRAENGVKGTRVWRIG